MHRDCHKQRAACTLSTLMTSKTTTRKPVTVLVASCSSCFSTYYLSHELTPNIHITIVDGNKHFLLPNYSKIQLNCVAHMDGLTLNYERSDEPHYHESAVPLGFTKL